MGCQGNYTVKRKEQLQDKDEVIPLSPPQIHSWVNRACAQQIQAVAPVLHPCSRNVRQRKETLREEKDQAENGSCSKGREGKERGRKKRKVPLFSLRDSGIAPFAFFAGAWREC